MAIKTEYLKDGELIRHYSDSGMMMQQIETDILYQDAVDVVPCRYTYEETDIPIPVEEAQESDYLSALKRFGVNV